MKFNLNDTTISFLLGIVMLISVIVGFAFIMTKGRQAVVEKRLEMGCAYYENYSVKNLPVKCLKHFSIQSIE